MLVEKQADAHPWATQMLMPSVAVEVGKTYVVSVWMKAMNPGSDFNKIRIRTGTAGLITRLW